MAVKLTYTITDVRSDSEGVVAHVNWLRTHEGYRPEQVLVDAIRVPGDAPDGAAVIAAIDARAPEVYAQYCAPVAPAAAADLAGLIGTTGEAQL